MRLKDRLGLWRDAFLGDPAGFIDGLWEPWRTLGLHELAIGAWASASHHARRRPDWRLAWVEHGPALVAAFAGDGTFLAATEARPGAPGLLRLRTPAARIEAWAYGGGEAGLRLEPWNGWRAFKAHRRVGAGMAAALKLAWPPSGPRQLPGGAAPFAPPGPEAYRAWIAANPPPPVDVDSADGPMFRVAVDDPAVLAGQTWPHWRIGQGDDTRPGEIAVSLEPGDRLAPDALASFAQAFADPTVRFVYADEDRIDADGGRCDPVFKTAFDAERHRRQDYFGAASAARAGAESLTVRHIPRVLVHRARPTRWPVRPLPMAPHASRLAVIVPTRDRPALLQGCAAGILERTDYPELELIVVDNGSEEPRTLALLRALALHPRVRVMRIEGPFDYPALNNAAAAATDAELLAFVNDDTWVIEPDWLGGMAALAARPQIGAVGAKLFYADGRIQHAGVTLGLGALGVAGHGFRGAPSDVDGPQGMLKVTREVSAVTAACLVVARARFAAVGGFDSALQVAFNDVDLCLRLNARGWKTVWTPEARMVHLESASRGRDASPERIARLQAEAAVMHERWGPLLAADPYYHPALSLTGERFALGETMQSWAPR